MNVSHNSLPFEPPFLEISPYFYMIFDRILLRSPSYRPSIAVEISFEPVLPFFTNVVVKNPAIPPNKPPAKEPPPLLPGLLIY
jgi:hypothetical protein